MSRQYKIRRALTGQEMAFLRSIDQTAGNVLLAFWRLFVGAEWFDNAETVECTEFAIPKWQWLVISERLADGKDILANGVMIWMNSGPSAYE